ncbi:hypothetical protein HD806DRAFT_266640 [Xylariaceae sp. AK1471]|nr:hypothetical protein HD806DRAFT_266640 [Xylariaceae sp. AK1471]
MQNTKETAVCTNTKTMLLSPAEENPFLQGSSRSLLNNVCHANSPGDATTQQLETRHQTAARWNHGKTWKVRKRPEDIDTVSCGSSANHHEKPVLSTRLSAVANGSNKTTQSLDRSEAISYTPELIARPPIQSTEAPILVDSNKSSSSTPSSSPRTNELPNSDNLSGKVADARLQSVDTSQNHTSANRELSNERIAFGLSPAHIQPSPNPHPPEASLPSARDLPSDLDNVPIQIEIGSAESKKYELRSFAKKAGLYYSCAVWPEELPHRNRSFVFGRLRTDLNNYIMRACKERKKKREMKKNRIVLTEQAFTLELRLSGRVSTNQEDVELRPTIWAICASGFYTTLVEEALTQCQLSWIADEPIEVVKGLSFNKQRARIAGLDLSKGFHFTASYQVHLHVEEPGEDNSACGLVVCATITKDGNIIDQCVSRLGGLIQINGRIVCASTAHGILDMLIAARLVPTTQEDFSSPREISRSDNESEAESDSTAATDPESDSDSVIQYSDTDDTCPELTGNPTISSITRWHTVPKAVIFDFVRAALPNPHNQSWTLGADARAHDFALFELWPDLLGKLYNSYNYKSALHRVTDYMSDFLPSNEIMVLLGHNTFMPGKVLPGKSKIYMAGVSSSRRQFFFLF